ncbi:MAG TPA: four helix bundle protein [Gemmatimonadaceae bacterium]|nr:four helix bundle protein [Gemmatimonadaceae bacterium]
MQDYRKLRVWRRAHAHVLNVRRATNQFPRAGYSTTKSQIMKSAESISFTLVEGCGAFTQKETARFVEMSIKSTKELEYQLFLARDYGILPRRDWRILAGETIEIRRMLCVFRRRVLGEDDPGEDEPGEDEPGGGDQGPA